MKYRSSRARLTALLVAVLFVVSAAAVHATITDDIDPQGASVFVTLTNNGPWNARGAVSVTAWVGSAKLTETTTFDLSAGASGTYELVFPGTVDEVHSVSIDE